MADKKIFPGSVKRQPGPGSTLDIFDIFGDNSIMAYYKFDGDVLDFGGNYNGVWEGTSSYSTGVHGQAIYTINSNYVQTPLTFTGFGHTLAVSLFFKSSQQSNGGTIIHITNDTGGLASITLDGIALFNDTSWDAFYKNLNYTYSDNNWHHIVVNFKPAEFSYFVDGQFIETITTKTTIGRDGNLSNFTNFGYQTSAYPHDFTGDIDQVRIFNRVLTAQEVQTLYNEG